MLLCQLSSHLTPNGLFLTFPSLPSHYSSSLSVDKLQITLRLPNTKLTPQEHQFSGSIFKQLQVHQKKDTAYLYIVFRQPSGYAIEPHPYSSQLLIRTLKWDTLSLSDQIYYAGLFAFESRLVTEAIRLFDHAGALGNARGYAYAGFLHLMRGQLADALVYLTAAAKNPDPPADVFAAIADIAAFFSKKELADKYLRHYQQYTKGSRPPRLLPEILDTLTVKDFALMEGGDYILIEQLWQELDQLSLEPVSDALPQPEKEETPSLPVRNEGVDLPSENAKAVQSPIVQPPSQFSFLIFLLGILFFLALLFLLLYFRWRRAQLAKQQSFTQLLEALNTATLSSEDKNSADQFDDQKETSEDSTIKQNKQEQQPQKPAELNRENDQTDSQSEPLSKYPSQIDSLVEQYNAADIFFASTDFPQGNRNIAEKFENFSPDEDFDAGDYYTSSQIAKKWGIPQSLLKLYRKLQKEYENKN